MRSEPKKFGRRYPWDEWFASASVEPITLAPGVDFVCRPYSFAQMVRNVASNRGLSVSVSVTDNGEVVVRSAKPHAKRTDRFGKTLVLPEEWS